MTKELVNNTERFDGFPVGAYEGKFNGTFDVEDDFAKGVAYDDTVTWLVTSRVSGVGFGDTKTGDIKRVNTFQVTGSTPLSPQDAATALHALSKGSPDPAVGISAAVEEHLKALTSADAVDLDAEDLKAFGGGGSGG